MKKLICISILCFAINSGGGVQSATPSVSPVESSIVKTGNQLKKKVPLKVVYSCPMHPEVLKNKPGKCPKCGMNLEKKGTVKKRV